MITASEAKRIAEESIKREAQLVIQEAFSKANSAVEMAAANHLFSVSFKLPTININVVQLVARELEKLSYTVDYERGNSGDYLVTLGWK